MKYVISRYNHDTAWIVDYTDNYILFDRSPEPISGSIIVPNVGSDIYDKLGFIIDNYDNLPDVAVYTKCNLFKYITKEEFDLIKDNKTFTPILTQKHPTVMCDQIMCEQFGVESKPYSFYKDSMYYELNYPSYIKHHPFKDQPENVNLEWYQNLELPKLVGIDKLEYIPFAPGSNYIVPKENILKHPKSFYEKLRSYLNWSVYPGEAMVLERGLYTIWK